jgi:hypothetical protein
VKESKKTVITRALAWLSKQTVLWSGLIIGIPVLLAALWIGVLIWIWDTPHIEEQFRDKANVNLNRSEKGALLAQAITYQFRRRLGDQGHWVPNDLVIFFERNAACAAGHDGEPGGIWYVTTEIFEVFADRTARIGGSSQDDSRLTNAAKKFNYDPRRWGVSWLGGADSEHEYALGLKDFNECALLVGDRFGHRLDAVVRAARAGRSGSCGSSGSVCRSRGSWFRDRSRLGSGPRRSASSGR